MNSKAKRKYPSSVIPWLNLNTKAIATKGQNNGAWCMRGEPYTIEYIASEKNLLMLTSQDGYLILPLNSINQIIEELQSIADNLTDIRLYVKG